MHFHWRSSSQGSTETLIQIEQGSQNLPGLNGRFVDPCVKAQCPDQRLNAQCESVCVENFSLCMESCADSRLVQKARLQLEWKIKKLISVASRNAIENMWTVLNIVLAIRNVQLVVVNVKIQFAKKSLFWIPSGWGWSFILEISGQLSSVGPCARVRDSIFLVKTIFLF